MDSNEQLFIIIQIVVSLVILVVFFVQANNVARLRKSLAKGEEDHKEDFYKYYSRGEYEKALEAAHEMVWPKLKDVQMGELLKDTRIKHYETVKRRYESYFTVLGKEFPKMVEYKK